LGQASNSNSAYNLIYPIWDSRNNGLCEYRWIKEKALAGAKEKISTQLYKRYRG
jgi:hypothetical protein